MTYRTATGRNLDVEIATILDTAASLFTTDADTLSDTFYGFAAALGAILSADERPAADILRDAIADPESVIPTLAPRT